MRKGLTCQFDPMDVPPRRIVWPTLYQPQMIDGDIPTVRMPLSLPKLIEQGFSLACIKPHGQGKVRREVPLLVLADDV